MGSYADVLGLPMRACAQYARQTTGPAQRGIAAGRGDPANGFRSDAESETSGCGQPVAAESPSGPARQDAKGCHFDGLERFNGMVSRLAVTKTYE